MSEGQRRLAAIMFTDMVGYSARAEADESAALALLERHNQLLRSVFSRHRGREIKTAGDAFLVEFESALDAVTCGLEVQRALREHNAGRPPAEEIHVRLGIHVGDVVLSGRDVLGDTVNIAARVEGLADPDEVCLTQQVVDQVRNKLDVRFVQLPPTPLKNIRAAVTVYRVAPASASERGAPAPAARPGHHLAVLPFANISPDPNDEYFADGLTEEVISVLSQVRDLSVIARTSVMPYKNAPKTVAQVGAELGVESILEGSVRKAGNRIRITLQLVDVGTQGHIWATSYNRELDDVFAIQSDIAERTASALQLELGKAAAGRRADRPGRDVVAYDLYLKGLAAAARPGALGLAEAERCFEEATRRDPTFAEAYASWADMYVRLAGEFLPMQRVAARARELAARAVELDPNDSEAHSALGNLAFQVDQDWARSEAEYRRAVGLNPNNVTAHRFFALMLVALDRLDEARDEMRLVARLDPGGSTALLGMIDLLDGRYDEVLASAEADIRNDPSAPGPHYWRGIFAAAAGRPELAREDAEFPLPADASDSDRYDHGLLNALVGRPEAALAYIRTAEGGQPDAYTSATHLAILYGALGDGPKALDLLEREYREGDRTLWLYYRGVWFDGIRNEPRFVALVRRYGLPLERVRGPPRGRGPGARGPASR